MTINSPASGYVFQKPVFKGTRVAPGEKIFDIVDLSTVWVLADIYEYEIPFVKKGQRARITLSYYPDKKFNARVDFIYPSLSGQTRTAKARFVIPNPDGLLKPQMFANVEMELDLGERLAIPDTSVLDTGTRQVVYVDTGDGWFSPRQIKTGDRANGMIEVLSGLKAGEKVASSGVFLIDSEAKLKGVSQ
jgi:Cu(I)/Ag(I) efflux system membrane fusion protein